jgi:uncharacterized glyoxalase superfamily protein PhnB
LSIEVDDVDAPYAVVRASGAEMVHPLQDEKWGPALLRPRPHRLVVNVLVHR